jgi:hypothetical protein
MQIIDIYAGDSATNVQNLKNALDQYGGDYFDNYEVGTVTGGNYATKFYIGNTCVLTITDYGVVSYGETTVSPNQSSISALTRLCVCSKGLVIFPGASRYTQWDLPLLIAKKTNGDLVLVYRDTSLATSTSNYESFYRYNSSGYSFYASSIAIVVFDKDTGAVHVKHYPTAFLNANIIEDPTTVIGQQLYDPVDGVMIDGVYLIPYMAAGDAEPGYFINNGKEYTGFAYNCLALRGT